jgi:CRP/FNR family transcriptional regulator, nitrogen fixation regulation protein
MNMHASSARFDPKRDRQQPLPTPPDPLKCLEPLAVIIPCRRGEEICCEGQPAEYWYRVISGTARRCVVRSDGRRQIVDLLLPGDFFGFTSRDEYDFTVEAVAEGTRVASYPRRRVEMLADTDPVLARKIRQVVFEALARLQGQLLILGRVTAPEKVGSFLLEMAARSSGGREDRVVLPISRYDIADYLAVSVETVSRSLTDLKHRGIIRFLGTRLVCIVDREALEESQGHLHADPFWTVKSPMRRVGAGHAATAVRAT